jgi:AbrB family looped-hinge helix DNA binding protein
MARRFDASPDGFALAIPMNYYIYEKVIQGASSMRSTITSRGQTVIPAKIRHQFDLGPSDRLEWVVDGKQILVFPVHKDPVIAFRGRGNGGSTERLLADRQKDTLKE